MADLLASLVPLLGQALLHFIWQGALIGLLAALALHSLRNARPQARYAVACLALLLCVLAPIVTMLVVLAPDALGTDFGSVFATSSSDAGTSAGGPLSVLAPTQAQLHAYLPAIVATWAAGTCLLSLRMALGLAWVRRMRHVPQGSEQLAWQARLDAMAKHFLLGRGVTLRLVDNLESPVSAGWLRPVVLLPAGLLTRMPTDLIEALLAHELAHIRRHDYLVNLLQSAVEAVLFYHPIVWWLSHRIRVEREQIADQLASEVECAPRRLALALSELSDLQRAAPGLAVHVVQAATGNQLMARIQRLLHPTRHVRVGARLLFPVLGLVAAGIATYAWAKVAAGEPGTTMHGTLYLDDKKHDDSFALVRATGDEMHMWGSIDDIDEIKAARKDVDGEYLWFRRGNKAYIVTDPALLARAREATRETDELDKKMEALEAQMEPHSRKMEILEERMDKLSDGTEPTPRAVAAEQRMEDLGNQLSELGRQQDELASRMESVGDDEALLAKLDGQLDTLRQKQDELARQMDEQAKVMDEETERLEAEQAPMEALSREMEVVGKPMEAIGEQMETQGRLMEQASERVEDELRKLIDEAVERKLATPLPKGAVTQ
jgi:beta-lactamase regulating signal transducer with metallopeptidase domain